MSLLGSYPPENLEESRVLVQAAREILLAESSDWTYMISREQASFYAHYRFDIHLERYYTIRDMFLRRDIDLSTLSSIEDTDNIFPWLDLHYW